MSKLRKVLSTKLIEIDGERYYAGERMVDAALAKQLTDKGAVYVDDDDYNATIKSAPKIAPASDSPAPATQPKDKS